MTRPLVAIRSVSKNFGEFQALNRLSAYTRFYDASLRDNMLTLSDIRQLLSTSRLPP